MKSQKNITLGKTLCAIFKASNSITQLSIIKLDINRLITETTLTHFSILYPIIALTNMILGRCFNFILFIVIFECFSINVNSCMTSIKLPFK